MIQGDLGSYPSQNCSKLDYYVYYVVFKGDASDSSPILRVRSFSEIRNQFNSDMHLFDPNLLPILPAVEYCLHMPRTEMDTYDVEVEVLDNSYDTAHCIMLIPDGAILEYGFPRIQNLALVIYTEDCNVEAVNMLMSHKPLLGCVSVKDLNVELLRKHWNRLYELRWDRKALKLNNLDCQFIFENAYMQLLPVSFLLRQYEGYEENIEKLMSVTHDKIFFACVKAVWNHTVRHNALMHCKGYKDEEDFLRLHSEGLELAQKTSRLNVIITMPGISAKLVKQFGLSETLPMKDKMVIRIMGIHRAIACGGILMELPDCDGALYEKLNELELNCKKETNNKYVIRSLKAIGRIIQDSLSKEQIGIISRAKHITVFSDFPLGIALFNNDDIPLHCYKETSYRPLTPLTRCFQMEVFKHRQIYWGNRCRILFIECIPNNSENIKIRACSAGFFQSVKGLSCNNSKISIKYEEALSVQRLKTIIHENPDIDVLHISAHGFYDPKSNMAGLVIGENEIWMVDENDFFTPPVVVLSACQISPRGRGSVNVADMFMRAGAEAVLGTFVPVNAMRNSILLSRFYTYISEAQLGSKQYRTVSECWTGVSATNIINELMVESKGFGEWIMGRDSRGELRLKVFELEKSKGKLHPQTMYKDTCLVLKQMLHDEGKDGKFDNVLSQEDYFPESFFYQWIGFPENILLYDEVWEKSINKGL